MQNRPSGLDNAPFLHINCRHQLQLREAVIHSKYLPFVRCWADFITVIFVNSFKECQESIGRKNDQGWLFTALVVTKIKITSLYLLNTILYLP